MFFANWDSVRNYDYYNCFVPQPSRRPLVPAPLQSTSRYDPVTSLQTFRDILEHGPELSDTSTKHQESHTVLESEHSYHETDHR